MRTLHLRNAAAAAAGAAHRVYPWGGFFLGELMVDPGWYEA
jgi:hypothetical protein